MKDNSIQKNLIRGMLIVSIVSLLFLAVSVFHTSYNAWSMTKVSFENIDTGVRDVSVSNIQKVTENVMLSRSESFSRLFSNQFDEYLCTLKNISYFVVDVYKGRSIGKKNDLSTHFTEYGEPVLYAAPGVNMEASAEEAERLSLCGLILKGGFVPYSDLNAEYVCMESGLSLVVDRNMSRKKSLNNIDLRKKEWYILAKKEKKPVYTLEKCFFSDEYEVALAMPIILKGDFIGVCAVHISLSNIKALFERFLGTQSLSYCIFDNTDMIFSSAKEGELVFNKNDLVGYRRYMDKSLLNRIDEIPKDTTEVLYMPIGKNMAYCVFSPIPDYGLNLLTFRYEKDVLESTSQLEKSIGAISDERLASIRYILQAGAFFFDFVIILSVFLCFYLSKKESAAIVAPIISLGDKVESIKGDDLKFLWNEHAEIELEQLAGAFSDMTEMLKSYIADTTREAAANERIRTEIEIARRIQLSAMPDRYLNEKGIEIFAAFEEASEIGGDFYDYYFTDDSHIAFVVCDVSGSGVSAALLMMMTKLNISIGFMSNLSPKEILSDINRRFWKQTQMQAVSADMWIGLLDLNTGLMSYAGGGSVLAAVLTADGELTDLSVKNQSAPGKDENFEYTESSFILGERDRLLMYTNGVYNMKNEKGNVYGKNRLCAEFKKCPGKTLEETATRILNDLGDFLDGYYLSNDMILMFVKRSVPGESI